MNDLLSAGRGALVAARFAESGELYADARRTFARHLKRGRHLWENAEQFLDILDQAREDRHLAKLITGKDEPPVGEHLPSPINELWAGACCAVADECSAFCRKDLVKGEAWQPYDRWKKQLTNDDQIITFNYDRVLETLGLEASLPESLRDGGPLPAKAVYKLHGSVDWALVGDDDDQVGKRRGRDGMPFLATPGPTKFKHTNDEGLLAPLWTAARRALRYAEAVVFVGYRFPPTDSHALTEILGALGRNEAQHLRLFTVLGPRVQDDDTVRLEQLLRRTMGGSGRSRRDPVLPKQMAKMMKDRVYDLRILPLYAQDYMATLNRAEFG